jgi:Putative zinc-finger
MNCEQVKGHLSAYLDDALSYEERQYVVSHVEGCLKCQRVLADFSHFDALLAQLPRVSPGPDLRERFFASQEYRELIGTSCGRGSGSLPESFAHLVPYIPPRSLSLPGGRQVHGTHTPLFMLARWALYPPLLVRKKSFLKLFLGQRLFYGVVVAGVLLMLGAGGLMSWRHRREKALHSSDVGASVVALPQQEARSPFSLISRNLTAVSLLFMRCAAIFARIS